jgi:hypothetical protein
MVMVVMVMMMVMPVMRWVRKTGTRKQKQRSGNPDDLGHGLDPTSLKWVSPEQLA